MSSLALMEVQRALYTKLSGDGVLMGLVSGVYDSVPQNTALPYVVIGNGNQNIRPAESAVIAECALRLEVWTEAGGRKMALTILSRLHALLHLGTLTVTGYQLVMLRVEQASTTLEEEGTLLNGRMLISVAVAEV